MSRDISGPHRNREHRTPRGISPSVPGPVPTTPVPDTPGTHHPGTRAPGTPGTGTGWDRWHRDRKAELPPDWATVRLGVLDRDGHRCTWLGEHGDSGPRCTARARVVDHIADAHDHRPANLRSLCTEHDQARTARQGASAARAARRRPSTTHPFIAEARQAGPTP